MRQVRDRKAKQTIQQKKERREKKGGQRRQVGGNAIRFRSKVF